MILEKPHWLRKKLSIGYSTMAIEGDLLNNRLHTICQEACCPNQGECFSKGEAAFLIMGNICTRNCRFCAVSSGIPLPLDPEEPYRLAQEVLSLRLQYVVVTSVTRDDLSDGGSNHFAKAIREIKAICKKTGIEVLIPDFKGSTSALETVLGQGPNVVNHNVETVPRLYSDVRPQANYDRSLELIKRIKEINSSMVTKSGLMVGLGETRSEVKNVMQDLRNANCDILTIGQYLCPSSSHHPVREYIEPQIFEEYKITGLELGFKSIVSGTFVRSSYRAVRSYKNIIEVRRLT